MSQTIEKINWFVQVGNMEVSRIGDDLILLDKPIAHLIPHYPFKSDVTTAIFCTKGYITGSINLRSQIMTGPCLAIILSDQIIQFEKVSEDFEGFFIIMSNAFTDGLEIEQRLSKYISIRENSIIPLSEHEMQLVMGFWEIMLRAVNRTDNPYRFETVKSLTQAFYYSWGYEFHKVNTKKEESKREQLLEKFLNQVKSNYKKHRGLDFYAQKLFLTPKHMSKIVKECSGKTASEWIDSYVILESKALLKSTNLTIQQISDELNFPSQSFFGKYFKRHTGVSPREYKYNT